MEVQEISDRLDYQLQKFTSGLALDEYVKSLYLTRAQLEYVSQISRAYEYGEELRHLIGPLIKTVEPALIPALGRFKGKLFKNTPDTIIKIVYERIGGDIPVIPLDTNDVHFTLSNPFRSPNNKIAYRIMHDDVIEVVSQKKLKDYLYIYIKEPSPIILENLPKPLKVGGLNTELTSVLSDASMIKIIDVAVALIIKEAKTLAPQPKPQPQQK